MTCERGKVAGFSLLLLALASASLGPEPQIPRSPDPGPPITFRGRYPSVSLGNEGGTEIPGSLPIYNFLNRTRVLRRALLHPPDTIPTKDLDLLIDALQNSLQSDTVAERLVQLLLRRSEARYQAKDESGAAQDIGTVRTILAKIQDEDLRRRNEADLLIAEVLTSQHPSGAVEALDRISSLYKGVDNPTFWERFYLARSHAYNAAGEELKAEEDLRRGIEKAEWQRTRVLDEGLRTLLFEQSDRLFDEMIRFLVDRLRFTEAYNYAERARGRTLLDRVGPMADKLKTNDAWLLGWREIQQVLPEDVVVVEYAVLNDRLLVWVVGENRLSFRTALVKEHDLDDMVHSLRAEMTRETSSIAFSRVSIALYDLLLRGSIDTLGQNERIVFVPDGSLHAVPFGALRDQKTGRYLIEDRTFVVAPSASFFLGAHRRDDSLVSGRFPAALGVGNPSFNSVLMPQLPRLPGAEKEVESLARLFPGSEVLIGEDATEEAFLAAAGRYEIVHFGGHAEPSLDHPSRSHLLLAPGMGSGQLYAHELYWTRFERTRLVSLGACGSASGQSSGDGSLSLARAFLVAGVPSVVASLQKVDDATTTRLFETFYQRLQQGEDPATALRHAQLALLADKETKSPASWAAFEALGAAFSPLVPPQGLSLARSVTSQAGATPPAP